jgi:NitT/TauT family transport system substrate-binding protein
MALTPSAKQLARIGLGMWHHGIDRPEARAHGLGWGDAQSYAETTDLVMRYLMPQGAKRPDPNAIFTNRFAGKTKLSGAQWASVGQRVSEFDKYLGRYQA